MKRECPHCHSQSAHLHGKFQRKSDSKTVMRFRCHKCHKTFSTATFSENYNQNKRRLNPMVFKLYSSGISGRRMALILNTTRKTIERKIIFLGKLSKKRHEEFLKTLIKTDLSYLQFDDLITSHHTKLKPVSVSTVITKPERKILSLAVSEIPSFGLLSKISVEKYGKRKNELPEKLSCLFQNLAPFLPEIGRIDTDEHKTYPDIIKKYLPQWDHRKYKSDRATVAGQGELKKNHKDPLFHINHTLAMMRANINRLFRRTWNTTKNLKRLEDHLWIYVGFHNEYLT